MAQLDLRRLFRLLHLLDGEVVAPVPLRLRDTVDDLLQLLLENLLLPLHGHGDFLELGVSDDDGVIVAGGDSGTEAFPVFGLEVLLRGYQDIGGGIELEILGSPLLCQMVGHHEQALVTEPQALALLGGGDHLEGLACPHYVCQQGVPAVENVGDGVDLVGTEPDFRVNTHEVQVGTVVFPMPWAMAVSFLFRTGTFLPFSSSR